MPIFTSAAAVFDDKSFAGRLVECRRYDAGDNVRGATRRIGDNKFHRAVRIGGPGCTLSDQRRRNYTGNDCSRSFDDAPSGGRREFDIFHCDPLSLSGTPYFSACRARIIARS
jgi:hypothetical protein